MGTNEEGTIYKRICQCFTNAVDVTATNTRKINQEYSNKEQAAKKNKQTGIQINVRGDEIYVNCKKERE